MTPTPTGPRWCWTAASPGPTRAGWWWTAPPAATIRTLVIRGFGAAGIRLQGGRESNIKGCYIGTDHTGQAAAANRDGVVVSGTYHRVGGAGAGEANVISGNTRYGVELADAGSSPRARRT